MVSREHVEEIVSGRHGYRIRMGGSLDAENTRSPVGYQVYDQAFEPNLLVRMENVGQTPVVNPWLMANGRDWRTLESIVAEVVSPEMGDAEKALALWTFQRGRRFHASPYDNDNRDPVKMLNVYGYTLCGDDSYVLADLWRAAGLRVRGGHPTGHSTTEVFYDGAYHLMDSDEHIICLKRDNRTIASMRELEDDPDLVGRTQPLGGGNHAKFRNWYTTKPYHKYYRKHNQYAVQEKDLGYVLRPFERFERYWYSTHKYHGQTERPEMPVRLGGGVEHWAAVVLGEDHRPGVLESAVMVRVEPRELFVGDLELPDPELIGHSHRRQRQLVLATVGVAHYELPGREGNQRHRHAAAEVEGLLDLAAGDLLLSLSGLVGAEGPPGA